MSRPDYPTLIDPGDLEPKHRVFLCHSGAQKKFVTELDAELRNMDRYPFFDMDTYSLPIGERFPDRILEAIARCQVGVVILTVEFFMRSPWPMFEVEAMVKHKRKIMPVFLGISPEDLSNEGNLATWTEQWRNWAISNKRIDIKNWVGAVKELRILNGLRYKHEAGAGYDAEFREEVVQEICKVVPPFHTWDDSHIQGKSRLSKVILEIIKNTPMCRGAQVVGLYGVGGIGKTTACKSLYKDLNVQFRGRVCHLEFRNDVSEEVRVREALKRLTGADEKSLKDKNLDGCWFRLKRFMRFQKVFLAIDNVSSISKVCEEARRYLEIEYSEGSIVMVTARGLGELRDVCIDERHCLVHMPELVKDEAEALFLDYANRSMEEVEQEVLRRCVERCYFRKGVGSDSHYLPLALKVLGSQLVSRKPSEWDSQLLKQDVFNLRGEAEDPVYSVLRNSYVDMKVELQLLFMDVALFDNDVIQRRNNFISKDFDGPPPAYTRAWDIFDWLSMVHGIKVDVVKERLDVLWRRSLLEQVGDGLSRLGTICGGSLRRWKEKESWPRVYEVVSDVAEESSLSGGGWENLHRICIMRSPSYLQFQSLYERLSVKRVNFTSCSKVTVLNLNVLIENRTLDLSPLKQLISLEIASSVRKVTGIGLLTNLAALKWFQIDIQAVSAQVEEISRLTNLQVLDLAAYGNTSKMLMLNLGELVWLRTVRARLINIVINIRLSSKMTSLRMLDLGNCTWLRSCVGVGDVVGLEVLVLNYCKRLKKLPNLEKLTKLRQLHVGGCSLLEALPGLGSLVALQELLVSHCYMLDELPDMSRLAKLEVLDLEGSGFSSCIPGLGALVALRHISVNPSSIEDWSDSENLTKLQVVRIRSLDGSFKSTPCLNLAFLEVVSVALGISSPTDRNLTNLSKLTALKNLSLYNCNLEALPDMGNDMCLESLEISGCQNLRRWDGVERRGSSVSSMEVDLHCSWTLPQLVYLEFNDSSMIELPDLSHFPLLRTFFIQLQSFSSSNPESRQEFAVRCRAEHRHLERLIFRYTEITSLPDLRNFPSLQKLKLLSARKMSSLTISGPLTALISLRLNDCQSLNALPDLDLFPRLHSVNLYRCGRDLTAQEVEKLEARGFRYENEGRWTSKPLHVRR